MGKFIVFEGADGTGTTTQTRLMANYLKDNIVPGMENDRVLETHEPSCGPIGVLIRSILRGEHDRPPNRAMELLFRSDRLYHLERWIKPYLEKDRWVVCDRYVFSTIIYQGLADSENSNKRISEIMEESFDFDKIIEPDLTIVLDVRGYECQNRIVERGKDKEIYEDMDFQSSVSIMYRKLAEEFDNYVVVNGHGTIEEVHNRCVDVVRERFCMA